MAASTLQRRQVIYSGNVQGVGFRFTTRRISQEFDVVGYVRNLPDGQVELVAEGEEEHLEKFLAGVSERMSGQIRNFVADTRPAVGDMKSFDIRY